MSMLHAPNQDRSVGESRSSSVDYDYNYAGVNCGCGTLRIRHCRYVYFRISTLWEKVWPLHWAGNLQYKRGDVPEGAHPYGRRDGMNSRSPRCNTLHLQPQPAPEPPRSIQPQLYTQTEREDLGNYTESGQSGHADIQQSGHRRIQQSGQSQTNIWTAQAGSLDNP